MSDEEFRVLLAALNFVVVHELAHQWMGGSVGTASSQDAWLREGLPTYVEALWTARHQGVVEAGKSMI